MASGLCLSTATAQPNERFSDCYTVTHIGMSEGLPHHFIDDIYKDSRGFLWVSTAGGGLCRYDGYEFVTRNASTPPCRLRSNFVRSVCEDDFGRLWVASEGGTDIIDLNTFGLCGSLRTKEAASGIADNALPALLGQPALKVTKDHTGAIWLQCARSIHRIEFAPRGEVTGVFSLNIGVPALSSFALCDVDRNGEVWAGIDGEVVRLRKGPRATLVPTPVSDALRWGAETHISAIVSGDNNVWIATDRGLFRHHLPSGGLKHYGHSPSNPHSLSQNFLTDLGFTPDGRLLVATLRGLNVYTPSTDAFERFTREAAPEMSESGGVKLNSDFINCLLADGDLIWLGTETGGINKLTLRRLPVRSYRHEPDRRGSLSANPVNAIYEDEYAQLWVGTVEGGLNLKVRGAESFVHFTRERGGLSHNSVSALAADKNGWLWVGTWGGGINLMELRPPHRVGKVISTQTEPRLGSDFIGALAHDVINRGIWVGTNRGLYFYDLDTHTLRSPLTGQQGERIHGSIGAHVDRTGKLWLGCLEGLYVIDLHSRNADGEFAYRHLPYKLDNPASLLAEKITSFCETRDGTLWLGSNGYGLYRHRADETTDSLRFEVFDTSHGLPNNSVRGLLEDAEGNLWVGTNNGLSCFLTASRRFVNYTVQDGLIDAQFYWNAAFRSPSDRRMYFGSVGGLIALEGRRPEPPRALSKVRFTRLTVGNEEVVPGSRYLHGDIAAAHELRLHEKDKSFSLEFSALHFRSDDAGVYYYRLAGFDEQWMAVSGNRRFARYTNLPPSTYTLQVKYVLPGADDGEAPVTELKIIVEPHFYKTLWFIGIVVALLAALVWQAHRRRIRTLERQKALLHRTVEERTREWKEQNAVLTRQNEKITRQKAQLIDMSHKVRELTLDKIAFFTNITHEFRTPLTLIVGPIERALKLSSNPQVIEQLNFVERNSKYLLSLVNQLMDFRKVESGRLEVKPSAGNVVRFMDALLAPFGIFAAERRITVRRLYRMDNPEMIFDEEAMNKVVGNLMSNAVKFTPDGGTVSLYMASLPNDDGQGESLYIGVRDTGTGIPEEDLDRIFHRFYQSRHRFKPDSGGLSGSGIGLYLCRRIVRLLGGTVTARNNRNAGSSFRLLLPLRRETPVAAADTSPDYPSVAEEMPAKSAPREELTVLVVEDNADMRRYIRSILGEHYHVLEAAHGEEALHVLGMRQVDFIVSDLMMPVMDGIELSRRVKETFAISHIPFLMLTAKTSPESRLESYRMGADEYLLKPFDETLLLTRIRNILDNRRRHQRRFALDMSLSALPLEEESGDRKFLSRVMDVIREHYADPSFEVGRFCEAVGVSKTLLNKKLQSLIGQSAGAFIRNYRLNMAHERLCRCRGMHGISVAEIAYETGFNDPKYFTRCFTRQFNRTPSAVMGGETGETTSPPVADAP